MEQFDAIERRRRNLRIVLFMIILATLPFYCAGILLWGTAPQRVRPTPTEVMMTGQASPTRVTATPIVFPSITPLNGASPTLGPLLPTPPQFFPPPPTVFIPTQPPPTDFIFPTPTLAPTLTPVPTLTPIPTDTPPPPPTDTPLPIATDTPFVSATPFTDSDGDGIPDHLDLCPFEPAFTDTGCPPTPETPLGPSDIIPPGS